MKFPHNSELNLSALIKLRNYFGEHDKTAFEHWAYSFLNEFIVQQNIEKLKSKETLIDFLKWYSDSVFLESEIGGRFIDYKKPDVVYTVEQIVESFMSSIEQNDKRSVARKD